MKIVLRHEKPTLLLFGPDDFPDDPAELEKGLYKAVMFEVYMPPYVKEMENDRTEDRYYGRFTFSPMPGNCGIVVSNDTFLVNRWRGQGSADRLHIVKEAMAKKLGYSAMLSTTDATNVAQVVSASKAGWKFVCNFFNKRTSHNCLVGMKYLK